MSFINCITNLAAEGILPKEKQINIEELYLKEIQKALDAGASETEAARLAGKATFESFQYQAIKRQRITIKQNMAVNKAKKYILNDYKNTKGKIDPPNALKRVVGFLETPEGVEKFGNVEIRTRVVRGELHNNMYDFLRNHRHTLIGSTRNKATLELVGKEMYSPGSSGNKAAEEIAESLIKTFELARVKFNEAGGSIPKANFRYIPQYHNSTKVGSISQKEWIDFVVPMLDRDKMINYQSGKNFDDAELKVALGEAYNNIITNGYATKLGGKGGSKMLANSKLDHRFIHFKDFDSWKVYTERFGDGDLFNVSITHIDKMARDIAMMQVMGPNPEAFLRTLGAEVNRWANLQDAKIKTKEINRARGAIEATENMFYYLRGDLNIPVNAMTAKNMATLRQLSTASYLGSAFFMALNDFNLTRGTAKFAGLPSAKAMLSNLRTFVSPLGGVDKNTRLKIAATSGLAAEHWSTLASAMSRYSADTVEAHEFSRRLADIVLRTTQLSWFTQAGRWGAGMESLAFFARNVDQSYAQIGKNNKTLQTYMQEHGIKETDWEIIRATKLYDAGVEDHKWKGALYLRADDIAARTDISPTLAQDLAYKYQHMIQDLVDHSVPVANARGATVISGRSRPGTVLGELARSILQFKQFPLTFMFTHMMRGVYRKGIKGKMGYILPLIITTTLMGAMTHELKNITKGQNISADDNYNNPKYWLNAMLHGGGLGFVGDIIFGGRYTLDGVSGRTAELAGPTAGLIFQTLDLVFGNVYQALDPEKKANLGADISKFLSKNSPGASAWYMRLVLERYLFEYIQELIDPKYQSKIKRKIKRTKKQDRNTYWWQPGQKSPSSGPSIFN
jgi:hypothetical protein